MYAHAFFSPTAECYGVFAQYRFRCGRAGAVPGRNRVPGTGSGNRFRELVPGTSSGNRIRLSMGSGRFCGSKVPVQKVAWKRFRRFRCLMGSEALGSVPEGLTELFLGSGFPEVLRRFRAKVSDSYSVLRIESILLYFESVLLYFESMHLYVESIFVVLCKYTFSTFVLSMLLYAESIFLQFESALLYVESILWKYAFVLWQYTFVLWTYAFVLWKYAFVNWKYSFVLWKYTFVLWTYTFVLSKCSFGRWKYTCRTLQIYFCTLPQCSSKEKVAIKLCTLQMQTSLLLGIPPTLISWSAHLHTKAMLNLGVKRAKMLAKFEEWSQSSMGTITFTDGLLIHFEKKYFSPVQP